MSSSGLKYSFIIVSCCRAQQAQQARGGLSGLAKERIAGPAAQLLLLPPCSARRGLSGFMLNHPARSVCAPLTTIATMMLFLHRT